MVASEETSTWILPEDRVIIFFITFLGFILRVWDLGAPSFWYDEVLTLHRSTILFNDSEGFFLRPPAFYLFVWFSINLLGESETTVRLPSVIFGTLTIPMVYLLTIRLQKDKNERFCPILSTIIFAFFPLHIAASREAKEYVLLSFLMVILFLIILEAVHHKSIKLLLLASSIQGMTFFTNFLAFAIFIPTLLYIFLTWSSETTTTSIKKETFIPTGLFFLFSTIFYIVWILIPRKGFHEPTKGLEISNWCGFGEFYWYFFLLMMNIGLGLLFVFLGIIKWTKKDSSYLYFINTFLLILFVLTAYSLKAQRYLVIAIPFVAILLAKGFFWLNRLFLENKQTNLLGNRNLSWIPVVLIFTLFLMQFLFLFGFIAGNGHAGYHPDWRGACSYVKNNSNSDIDTFWSTEGTIRIASYYLGRELHVNNVSNIESYLMSTENTSVFQMWIIVTKNRFERKITEKLQKWIQTNGILVWDTPSEDLTTQKLAELGNTILDPFGYDSMTLWSLDRMRVFRIDFPTA